MEQIDMFVAQIKQLQRKLERADNIEKFRQLSDDLKELLALYDDERKKA